MVGTLVCLVLFLFTFALSFKHQPSLLYIWSGQNKALAGKDAADFIAIVDYTFNSPSYGSIIKTIPLPKNHPTINTTGNEPHHCAISSDRQYFAAGGLLSFLQGGDQIFLWKINPLNPVQDPVLVNSYRPQSGCTDEFIPYLTNTSQFLISQMCSLSANSPGEMLFLDAKHGLSSMLNSSTTPGLSGYNPHGFDLSGVDNSTIFQTDYILPYTLLASSANDLVFDNTVRQLQFNPTTKLATLVKTFNMPRIARPGVTYLGTGNGFMTIKFIPGDPLKRGYTCGTQDNFMYLVTADQAGVPVFDMAPIVHNHTGTTAGLIAYTQDGSRLLMSFQMRYVILFDITNPPKPKPLQVFDFCLEPSLSGYRIPVFGTNKSTTYAAFCAANGNVTGSHYLIFPQTEGEDRFVVVNYFLQFGLAQFAGTRLVHSFTFNSDYTRFTFDRRFNPNFHDLYASPHGVSYIRLP